MCPSPHRPSESVFVCRSSSQQVSNVLGLGDLEKRGKERGLMYKYDIPALYLRIRSTQHKNASTTNCRQRRTDYEFILHFLIIPSDLSSWKEILFDAGMISKFR